MKKETKNKKEMKFTKKKKRVPNPFTEVNDFDEQVTRKIWPNDIFFFFSPILLCYNISSCIIVDWHYRYMGLITADGRMEGNFYLFFFSPFSFVFCKRSIVKKKGRRRNFSTKQIGSEVKSISKETGETYITPSSLEVMLVPHRNPQKEKNSNSLKIQFLPSDRSIGLIDYSFSWLVPFYFYFSFF